MFHCFLNRLSVFSHSPSRFIELVLLYFDSVIPIYWVSRSLFWVGPSVFWLNSSRFFESDLCYFDSVHPNYWVSPSLFESDLPCFVSVLLVLLSRTFRVLSETFSILTQSFPFIDSVCLFFHCVLPTFACSAFWFDRHVHCWRNWRRMCVQKGLSVVLQIIKKLKLKKSRSNIGKIFPIQRPSKPCLRDLWDYVICHVENRK